MNGCTTTGVQNYNHKSSDRPDSDVAGNSLRFERLLAYHVSSRQLQISLSFLLLNEQASRAKSLCEPRRSSSPFEHLL
ncbi:hypothetical protein TNCV_870361 [Trichonephila clavipes]|nr:hypothetical protein TNCV_870361 [Trichonephila clavipes]